MRQSAPASVMADRQRSQSMYAAGRESEVEVDVSSFTRYADEPAAAAPEVEETPATAEKAVDRV